MHLKLAFRRLFKTPFVTIVAIVSLALGIGANAAIFSLFNEMLLRPLPVPRPNELVNLAAPGPKPGSTSCNIAGNCEQVFSYPMFRDLQQQQTVFTNIAAHRTFGANLAARGETQNGDGMLVSGSYFSVLGIRPAIGRLIRSEDDRAVGESHVAVLSYGYWQWRFGGSPGVLGEQIVINGQSMTIIGVTPQGFEGTTIGARPQVFVPITMRGLMNPGFNGFHRRQNYWAYLFGRLRPGVSIEQARAALNTRYHTIINEVEAPLQRGMSDQTMKRFRARELRMEPGSRGQSSVMREARAPLTLLLGVTGFVLVIACANIANLLLARAAGRASEMAVRLSIGAKRRDLILQLLTESMLLAVLGGLAGLVVARWTLDLVASILPVEAAQTLDFKLDPTVLLFAAGVTIATGVLFGLFPALHSTRPDLASTLKNQSGQPAAGRGAARFRTSLATAQIALSMALLIGAGLFVRSLLNVSRVELGIKIDRLVTFGVSPELNGYTAERSKVFFARLEEQLAAIPGVTGVSSSLVPALAGSNWGNDVAVEGFKAGPDTDSGSRFNDVGPAYFRTMGVQLLGGREFTTADTLTSPKVAIVNEAFAQKFNLGRNAVGKRLGSGEGYQSKLDTEIVGVVQNAKYSDVKDEVPPLFFRPYRQDESIGQLTFYVRTSLEPEELLASIPPAVRRIDPNLPVERLLTMPQQVRDNVFLDRMITTLSAAFAVLATLLAAVGLYGVLAYTVAQRTREIGLRMALGAAPERVRAMVLAQVAKMTLVGGVVGLAAAGLWLAPAAEKLLFELKGRDPWVFVFSAVLLSAIALLAGFVPALRASRVEPMWALRYE